MRYLALILFAALGSGGLQAQQWGGELRFSLRSEPRTLNPMMVDDDSSETVRYLTGGVLIRVNRVSQQLTGELAKSWKIENGGRTIVFALREGISFSDGTPFTAEDVAYTMQVLMDPNLHSPTGDTFRSGPGEVKSVVRGPCEVAITFPEPVAGVARLFDQVAMMSKKSPLKERAVLGPFRIAEHKPGTYILLSRNPNYWKMERGRRLPYLDSIRMDIQQNRELELLRFRRGQVHLISQVDADAFEQLAAENRALVRDLGPSLEGEILWFNLNPAAPIESYRKAWFASREFRLAISHAIRRQDLAKVAYRGHGSPGVGPFSAANLFWFNRKLAPHGFDLEASRKLLSSAGFRGDARALYDREGHPVEFSLVTNSGNKTRERIGAMLQQDLAALGIRLNLVSLDFPSLIERISKSSQYEACLLGLVNVGLDPSEQMNVWLSSSANHPWNPNQKAPATAWEGEIDKLMRQQGSTALDSGRKPLFDRVQQVVHEQSPVLYLVYRNALVALSPSLRNAEPSILRPQALWNVERLWIATAR